MKRNMDLIRELLFLVEDHDGNVNRPPDTTQIGHDSKTINGHYRLLKDARLLDALVCDGISCEEFLPQRLTWKGHDFLDSIRDPEIWRQTKEGAEAAGGFTLEILGDLAKGFIKTKIKQHTDVDI